jgi:hypothetical protein
MKAWILVALFVLLGIAVVFISFNILQFDPNHLRPQLEDHLSGVLQAQVKISSLSVQWGVVPRLEIHGIQITDNESGDIMLSAAKARGSMRLFPLFNRELWMGDLELESPRLNFHRRSDKTWNWNAAFLGLPPPGPVKEKRKNSRHADWKIEFESLKASHAVIEYLDESLAPHFYQRFEDLQIESVQAGPSSPFVMRFEMPFAKSSRARGQLRVDAFTQHLYLKLVSEPYFSAEIRVRELFETPRFTLKGMIADVAVQEIAFAGASKPPLTGQLSAQWEGTGEGFHPQDWMRTFILKSDFSLAQGRLTRLNVVRQAFRHLSIIPVPGLSDLTELDFPLDFYETVQGSATPFTSAAGKLQWSDGKIFIDELQIGHSEYQMQFGGSVNLTDGYAQMRGAIAFSQEVSDILVSGVPALDVLKNLQNEVLIPLEYRGNWLDGEVEVDVAFVANRFVQIRGEELASLGIQKLNEFMEAHRS